MTTFTDRLITAFRNLGVKNGTKHPAVINSPDVQAAVEYAMASALAKAAEERKQVARLALLPLAEKHHADLGTHVVVDSPFVTATVQVVRGARRLDEKMLLDNIMKQCKLDKSSAQHLIDQSKVIGDNQLRLTATLAE
jgi:hypothetical protein